MTTTLIADLQIALAIAQTLLHEIVENLNLVAIGLICLTGWHLTKGDTWFSRIVRILASLVMISQAFKAMHTGNEMEGYMVQDRDAYTMQGLKAMACLLPLAFVWASPVSRFFGNLVVSLIDPEDTRSCNPRATTAKLDRLAKLANQGRKSSAIRLARQMKRSGDYSAFAMDAMIARLKSDPSNAKASSSARRSCTFTAMAGCITAPAKADQAKLCSKTTEKI